MTSSKEDILNADNQPIEDAPVKKKRGRKPKQITNETISSDNVVSIPKKRGRKPKGGKIITTPTTNNENEYVKKNVILHLKCSLKDIKPSFGSHHENVDSYSMCNNKASDLSYHVIAQQIENGKSDDKKSSAHSSSKMNHQNQPTDDTKQIWNKLKELQNNLHNNNISDKKSACFWCTCDFDNPPIFIPKHKIRDSFLVYGCFCSPECSVSYLMNETIDASIKFERYQLLNYIYCKIYNYTKNIKPAPSPYYILDKYYGNLTIQEYRKIMENDRLLMVIDKPLTRTLPELHEENNDFTMENSICSNTSYKIKKRSTKTVSKNDIVQETFGGLMA